MVSKYCRDCIFFRSTYPANASCDYIGVKKERRGCPSSDQCTKKEVRRNGKRQAKKESPA